MAHELAFIRSRFRQYTSLFKADKGAAYITLKADGKLVWK
jgi:hypothetical protein